ncbi:hypothetical protein Droror1_Dr00011714 [Drosera rotundifolia]
MAPTSAIRSSLTLLSLHLSLRSPAIKPSFLSTLPRAPPFAASPHRSRLNHNRSRTASMVVRAARVESKEVVLGSKAPRFQLPEPLTGRTWILRDFDESDVLLVMFICNHCPFVIHLKEDIVKLSNFYMKKGLSVVAISSNSVVTHPQDGPEYMAEEAKLFCYPFPYLYDESQDVARDFGALCTPEFFLFKKDEQKRFELVYHGQFDDSRPSNNLPITGKDLRQAIECALSGQPIPSDQKPSVGCSIKWHPLIK